MGESSYERSRRSFELRVLGQRRQDIKHLFMFDSIQSASNQARKQERIQSCMAPTIITTITIITLCPEDSVCISVINDRTKRRRPWCLAAPCLVLARPLQEQLRKKTDGGWEAVTFSVLGPF